MRQTLLIFFLIPLLTTAQRVIVLGFDGMGGQALKKVHTPNFDSLRANGAYTYKAEAVIPTSSSSNWAAMINGAPPRVNTVHSNNWERTKITGKKFCGQKVGEIFPTIFKVLREQKLKAKIACVHHWDGFARLANTEAMDTIINTKDEFATCKTTCELIEKMQPDFLFVHFDHVDHAGHEYGHFTPQYYRSIDVADSLTGLVINQLKKTGLYESTTIIVTADHGGIRKGHGGLTRKEIEIPWIIAGPAINKNQRLKMRVRQYDTAPTIAHVFKLAMPECWKGKPVKTAFLE